LNRLCLNFEGEIPGNRKAIMGTSLTNDKRGMLSQMPEIQRAGSVDLLLNGCHCSVFTFFKSFLSSFLFAFALPLEICKKTNVECDHHCLRSRVVRDPFHAQVHHESAELIRSELQMLIVY
jgi:hypothetical protein